MKHTANSGSRVQTSAMILALVLALGLAVPSSATASESWLHVRVDSADGEEKSVRLNLPLSVARVLAPAVESQVAEKMKVRPGKMDLQDLRNAWRELRKLEDADFVEIRKETMVLKIALRGDQVTVKTTEDSDTHIDIAVPSSVVDALLEGEGDTLNVTGALDALLESRTTRLVSVRDAGSLVQVWIDKKSTF